MSDTPAPKHILDGPGHSEWLKRALKQALFRDPVKAAADAALLAKVLSDRAVQLSSPSTLLHGSPMRKSVAYERILVDGNFSIECVIDSESRSPGGYLYVCLNGHTGPVPVGAFEQRHDGMWTSVIYEGSAFNDSNGYRIIGCWGDRKDAIVMLWNSRHQAQQPKN